jgi:ABC-type multidrug transport system ATPase subunit
MFGLTIKSMSGIIYEMNLILLADLSTGFSISVPNNPAQRNPTCSCGNEQCDASGRCVPRFRYRLNYPFPVSSVATSIYTPPNCTASYQQNFDECQFLFPFRDNLPTNRYNNLFVSVSQKLYIYGLQPDKTTAYDVFFDQLNEFYFLGTIKSIQPSENGMHAFVALTRKFWELEAMERIYNVCQILAGKAGTDKDREFFAASPENDKLVAMCSEPIRLPSLNDFFQYIGVCPPQLFCFSLVKPVFTAVGQGYYSPDSFRKEPCPPGFFCPQTMGHKMSCPPGYICPEEAMSSPRRCPFSVAQTFTCSDWEMTQPKPCPPGSLCTVPYFPPIPSPPGYFVSRNGVEPPELTPCHSGDDECEYCPFGQDENISRLCPNGLYCPDSSQLLPSFCGTVINNQSSSVLVQYCPEGMCLPSLCPAGYYCNVTHKFPCDPGFYCPMGSGVQLPCPAGSYCKTPAQKAECPEGYYCPEGSIFPNECSRIEICPPGSQAPFFSFGGVLLIAIVLLLLVFLRYFVRWLINYRREQRRKIKKHVAYEVSKWTGVRPKQPVDIQFENLGLELKNGTKVLNNVTGTVYHGRVTAIMGPSGAGKTTFMMTLAGKAYYGKTTGTIKINGKVSTLSKIRKIMGYVPQEDIMLRELTVNEVLTFAAGLRLPSSISLKKVQELVNYVIRLLNLEEVKNSPIGDESSRGISGGQRKRVNIGMELVADPTVLFLDEPTSGLDSTSSKEVCQLLRNIARAGLTVVTVIHQPRYDIFTMFDDVLLLGKGGRTVYLGPTSETLAYFEKLGYRCPLYQNPADFFMDVISGAIQSEGGNNTKVNLFECWERHVALTNIGPEPSLLPYEDEENLLTSEEESTVSRNDQHFKMKNMKKYDPLKESLLDKESKNESFDKEKVLKLSSNAAKHDSVPILRQFFLFLYRGLLQQYHNPVALLTDVLLVVFASTIFGLVFSKSFFIGPPPAEWCEEWPNFAARTPECYRPLNDPIPLIGLMTSIGLSLPAAMAGLRVFGPERVVYWREASSGINTIAYFLGKDVAHIPSLIILPMLFTLVFISIRFVMGASFGQIYTIYLLLWWGSTGLSYIISVTFAPNLATLASVVFAFSMAMFAGLVPSLKDFETTFKYLVWLPYISMFRWSTEAYFIVEMEGLRAINQGAGSDLAYELMSYHSDNYSRNLLILFILGLGFRIIACLLMVVLHREKKK